jgi:hypothetical protein
MSAAIGAKECQHVAGFEQPVDSYAPAEIIEIRATPQADVLAIIDELCGLAIEITCGPAT